MQLSEVVRRRRMVRSYNPDMPVDREVLVRVLTAATRAPSAGYSQGWDFVVLTTAADRDRFWAATSDASVPPDTWLTGMRTAPALVLCLSDPGRYLRRYAEPDKGQDGQDPARWPVAWWDTDTAMAALLMLLTAVDHELGGCFFGVPPQRTDAVKRAFGCPADRRVVGVVALGHPAPDRRSPSLRRGHRSLDEVAHDGRFGVPFA